jgi:hypothetical protein
LLQKDIEKKVNVTELSQDAIFLIAPILLLYYELSVCPLILNYNKVYLAAALTAKPSIRSMFRVLGIYNFVFNPTFD